MTQKNKKLPEIKARICELEKELTQIEKEEGGIKTQLLVTDGINHKGVMQWLETQIEKVSYDKNAVLQQLDSLREAQVQLSTSIQLDKLKEK